MLLCCYMLVDFARGPSQTPIIQGLEFFNHLVELQISHVAIDVQVRPLMAPMLAPKGSRLSNDVRIRRRASTSGTRRGAKPADHVLASGSHRRMTRLILQPMLT